MDYEATDILMVLNVIQHTNTITSYLKQNMEIYDIAQICTFALSNNYLIQIDEKLKLTAEGKEFLSKTNKELGRKDISKFISIPSKYRIKKISLETIYLPEDM